MGKSTMSMAIFTSFLYVYQSVTLLSEKTVEYRLMWTLLNVDFHEPICDNE